MLKLDPVPSRSLRLYVWLVHAWALLGVGVSGIPIGFKVGLACVIGISFFLLLHRVRRTKITALEFLADKGWLLHLRNGQTLAGHLMAGSSVRRKMAFLHFKTDKGMQSLMLMRDSVPSPDYRKLRVLVRIKPSGLMQTTSKLFGADALPATKADSAV